MKNKILHIIVLICSVLVFGSCERHVTDWACSFSKVAKDPFGVSVFDEIIFTNNHVYRDLESGEYSNQLDTITSTLLCVGQWNEPRRICYNESVYKRSQKKLATIIAKDEFWNQEDCHPFDVEKFAEEIKKKKRPEVSKIFIKKTGKYYYFPTEMCRSRIYPENNKYLWQYDSVQVIATIDDEPVALKYVKNDGAPLLLVSIPLLFTNYGSTYVYDDTYCCDLIVDLMNEVSGFGSYSWLLHYESVLGNPRKYETEDTRVRSKNNSNSSSVNLFPFLEDLCVLSVIALFIGFLLYYSKRRQRIIPVINKPKNRTVDFAQQIGKNYYWKKESGVILRKKIVIFLELIRERTNLRFENGDSLHDDIVCLSKLIGLKNDEVEKLFVNLFEIQRTKADVSLGLMKNYINKMNVIINKLK
jgi:hypothetical protein